MSFSAGAWKAELERLRAAPDPPRSTMVARWHLDRDEVLWVALWPLGADLEKRPSVRAVVARGDLVAELPQEQVVEVLGDPSVGGAFLLEVAGRRLGCGPGRPEPAWRPLWEAGAVSVAPPRRIHPVVYGLGASAALSAGLGLRLLGRNDERDLIALAVGLLVVAVALGVAAFVVQQWLTRKE